MAGRFEFRILGPTEVWRGDELVRFRGRRELALVALLAVEANRVVSAERLVEDLWGEATPAGAVRSLRVYMSRIRQALGHDGELLVTRAGGYLLRAAPETVDAIRFESLIRQGRRQAVAGDSAAAADTFREALALWRGAALADVADIPRAAAEAARLEEARLVAFEERLDADLACGRHGEVVAELDLLTRANPFRERLWAQRITALYRAGRQADALRAYQDLRQSLGNQLGIDPSPELARLETAVLRHDPRLDWQPGTTPAAEPPTIVTFLFTDVVGSTELLAQLGEAAAEEARRAHFGLLRETVTAHGGTEVKNLGDGLMVAFASPVAAVRCAVDMQRRVAESAASTAGSMAVRIGLHAGEAMRDDGDFFGTPVVIAKRLCDQAQGGQILASALVSNLVGHRGEIGAFRHLGALSLKGLAEPVAAVEVVWRSPAVPTAPPAGSGGQSPLPALLAREERFPLVGREGEMAKLDRPWAETRNRQRLLLVGGEPGIGKTRLAADFAKRIHGEGAVVLFGRCDEGMAVPYQPFVEALGRYLRDTPVPVLGRMAGELSRLVPEVGERVPGLPFPSRSDPESERYRLFEAVAAWLAAVSEQCRVLFVLDDLHWATQPTLLLLSHLVRSDEAMAVLMMATYRDSPLDVTPELADTLAELLRQPGVARLRLGGLDETGVAGLMEAHAHRELDDDGRALARIIHGETAGNPFFVREVLRHLTEKGDLPQPGQGWPTGKSATEVDMPDSVREVVGRRLTRLPDKTDQILALAAVVGEHFDLAVVVDASGESADSVLQALAPAVNARLVDETGVGRYRFAHALVRSTLEEALGPTRRAQLHLRAAEAVESVYDEAMPGRAAMLAAHHQKAGSLVSPDRVVQTLIRAGEEAAALLAWEQADGHWQAALDLMDRSGPTDDRRADLLARLADLLYTTGDIKRAIAHTEEAITLLADRGDQQRTAVLRSRLAGYLSSLPLDGVMDMRRALGELDEAERVLRQAPDDVAYGYLLGIRSTATGIYGAQPEDTMTTAPRAVEIARRHGRDALRAMVELSHGSALLSVGAVEEGIRTIERSRQTADRLDHRLLSMWAAHVRASWGRVLREPLVAIAWTERELAKPRMAQVPLQRQYLQGQCARAYALTGRVADAERLLEDPGSRSVVGGYGPPIELWQGDWETAEADMRHWRERCRAMGNRLDEALCGGWLAEVCRLRGDAAGAEGSLAGALAIVVPAHHRVLEVGFRIDLTILHAAHGHLDRARQELMRAKEHVGDDWRGLIGRLALAEATTLALAGDHEAAGAQYERAIEVFRHYQLPWDEAEAFLLWSRTLGDQHPGSSAEKLVSATGIYRRCGAGPSWLARLTTSPEGQARRS